MTSSTRRKIVRILKFLSALEEAIRLLLAWSTVFWPVKIRSGRWSVVQAHGVLGMTMPGDTGMMTLKEVMQVMEGVEAQIAR